MIRIHVADRTFDFDETRPLAMGDYVAIREMGVDPNRWASLVDRLKADDPAQLTGEQSLELGEALIQLAYLAAVRKDHALTWREFIWTVPLAGAAARFEVVEDAPVAEPKPALKPRAKAKTAPQAGALGPMLRQAKAAKTGS